MQFIDDRVAPVRHQVLDQLRHFLGPDQVLFQPPDQAEVAVQQRHGAQSAVCDDDPLTADGNADGGYEEPAR